MRLILLCLVLAVGCGPRYPHSAHAPKAAMAPIPPFSADEIRASMPVGERLRFQLVEAGKPPVTTTWEVLAAGPEEVAIRYTMRDAQGGLLGEPQERTSTWLQLEQHAHFPPQATEWSEEATQVPAGSFAQARTYVVHQVEEGQPIEVHYTFALSLPGPPVRVVTLRQGDETMRMELLERAHPAP